MKRLISWLNKPVRDEKVKVYHFIVFIFIVAVMLVAESVINFLLKI